MEPEQKQERTLDKIQALLDKANATTFPGERDECLRLADALMAKNQIDEAMLAFRQKGKIKRREAVKDVFPFVPRDAEYTQLLGSVSAALARLAGVRVVITGARGSVPPDIPFNVWYQKQDLTVVGMEDDVKYFQMLWLNAYMTYTAKLFPSWDNSKTLAWNIKAQKEAGIKWPQIYDLACNNGWPRYRQKGKVDVNVGVEEVPGLTLSEKEWHGIKMGFLGFDPARWPQVGRCPNDGGYFKRLYEKQCELDGVEATNHTQRNAAYRESYAMGFTDELQIRVQKLISARNNLAQNTVGAAVALRDSRHLVDALYDELFPPGQLSSLGGYQRQHGVDLQGTGGGIGAARNVSLMQDRNNVGNSPTERKALG